MTPNGTVTIEGVKLMIIEGLKEYDIGNSARHRENTAKMDAMMSLLWKMVWGILITLLTAGASLIVHLAGK